MAGMDGWNLPCVYLNVPKHVLILYQFPGGGVGWPAWFGFGFGLEQAYMVECGKKWQHRRRSGGFSNMDAMDRMDLLSALLAYFTVPYCFFFLWEREMFMKG